MLASFWQMDDNGGGPYSGASAAHLSEVLFVGPPIINIFRTPPSAQLPAIAIHPQAVHISTPLLLDTIPGKNSTIVCSRSAHVEDRNRNKVLAVERVMIIAWEIDVERNHRSNCLARLCSLEYAAVFRWPLHLRAMIFNNSLSHRPLLFSHQIHANFAQTLVPINITNTHSITVHQMERFQLNFVISQLTDIITISISESRLKSLLSRNMAFDPPIDNRTSSPQCFLLYIKMGCFETKKIM